MHLNSLKDQSVVACFYVVTEEPNTDVGQSAKIIGYRSVRSSIITITVESVIEIIKCNMLTDSA